MARTPPPPGEGVMSALTAPPQTPDRRQAPVPARRRRPWRWVSVAACGAFMLIVAPVVLLLGAANPPCPSALASGTVNTPAGGGPLAAGMYAQPLRLEPGRWYRVGATE